MIMRLLPLAAAAATLLLAAACASTSIATPVSSVRLLVQPASVSAGGTATLVLANGSSADVGYNLCTSGLERRQGDAWSPVPSDRVCTMELRSLAPGAEARYELELPGALPAGEYRALTSVEVQSRNEMLAVTSDPFRVTAR